MGAVLTRVNQSITLRLHSHSANGTEVSAGSSFIHLCGTGAIAGYGGIRLTLGTPTLLGVMAKQLWVVDSLVRRMPGDPSFPIGWEGWDPSTDNRQLVYGAKYPAISRISCVNPCAASALVDPSMFGTIAMFDVTNPS